MTARAALAVPALAALGLLVWLAREGEPPAEPAPSRTAELERTEPPAATERAAAALRPAGGRPATDPASQGAPQAATRAADSALPPVPTTTRSIHGYLRLGKGAFIKLLQESEPDSTPNTARDAPPAGTRVELREGERTIAATTTDDTGWFRLEVPERAGTVFVVPIVADSAGLGPIELAPGDRRALGILRVPLQAPIGMRGGAEPRDLAGLAEQLLEDEELEQTAPTGNASLRLTLVRANGEPHPGAEFIASGHSARTDDEGVVEWTDLPAGTTTLVPPRELLALGLEAEELLLRSGRPVERRLTLAPFGRLAGTLRDAHGRLLPGAKVELRAHGVLLTTDLEGRFETGLCPTGTFEVCGGAPDGWRGLGQPSCSTVVVEAGVPAELNLELAP